MKSPFHEDSLDWSPSVDIGYADKGPKDVFVYILKVETANVIKIGITNNLHTRIATIERETGYLLESWGTSEFLFRHQARALEAVLHSIFFEKRIHGEFFEVSKKDLLLGLLKLGDLGFGSPEQYLGGLLPKSAGIGDLKGQKMTIGYVKLPSMDSFLDFQIIAEKHRVQRCYIDYGSTIDSWRDCRMDLRDGDIFFAFLKRSIRRFSVSERLGKSFLVPLSG